MKTYSLRENIAALRDKAKFLRAKAEDAEDMANQWLSEAGIDTKGLPAEWIAQLEANFPKLDNFVAGYWNALLDAAEGFGEAASLLDEKADELEEILERQIARAEERRHFRTGTYNRARAKF